MTLLTLGDAKLTLGIDGTLDDDLLQDYVDAATPVIEDLVGPVDVSDYIETYDGGATQIVLLHAPVTAVTEVIESLGASYVRVLAAQDIFTGGDAGSFAYTLEAETGVVTRRAAGVAVCFATGTRNVRVTYSAGRVDVPANIHLAAMELVRSWWQIGQQGNRPGFGEAPEMDAFTPSGYAVPSRVIELCAAQRRIPGIA